MWTHQEDQRISDVVIEHIYYGQTQHQAFYVLHKELNKSRQSIENRWFTHIRPLKEAEIKAAKIAAATRPPLIGPAPMNNPYRKPTWLKATDDLIARYIIKKVASGMTQTQAIELLSKTLPFDPSEINRQWQQEIRPHYKQQLEEAKSKKQVILIKAKIRSHENEIKKLEKQLAELTKH